jgi:hypothetical protein
LLGGPPTEIPGMPSCPRLLTEAWLNATSTRASRRGRAACSRTSEGSIDRALDLSVALQIAEGIVEKRLVDPISWKQNVKTLVADEERGRSSTSPRTRTIAASTPTRTR